MSKLLRGQEQVSAKRPMPVNDVNVSSQTSTSSSATVQLYYYNAGVRTTDAGQAAGVVVDAVFAHKNILNSTGIDIASKVSTSLAYTCDALTTELEWEQRPDIVEVMEALDSNTDATLAAQVGALLNNGEFIIDYRKGLLIGKKATTTATMTNVTYKYSTGLTVTVDSEFPAAAALADATANPTTTTTGANMFGFNGTTWDRIRAGITAVTATLTGWLNILPWAIYNATPTTRTEGQGGPVQSNSLGAILSDLSTLIAGENVPLNVLGIHPKPIATNDFNQNLDVSGSLEASSISKASAGNLYWVCGRIDATCPTGTYYFQVMNSATLPADGAVTLLLAPTKLQHVTGTDTPIVLGMVGECVPLAYGSSGIVSCLSTTEFTKTIAGAYLSTTIGTF